MKSNYLSTRNMPYYTYFYNTYKLDLWLDEEETTVKCFKNNIVGMFHNLSCSDIDIQIIHKDRLYKIDDNELIDPDYILDLRLAKCPNFPTSLRQITDLDDFASGSEDSGSDSEGESSDSEDGSDGEDDSDGSDSGSDGECSDGECSDGEDIGGSSESRNQ